VEKLMQMPAMIHHPPGYWMRETSGILRPIIERYLDGESLNSHQLAVMRGYLRQWIYAEGFFGPDVAWLRAHVGDVTDMHTLHIWLERALEAGVCPL
jgi:hypothetical protein